MTSRPALCLLVLATSAACWRKPTDEALLKKRLDTTPVHLYLSSKLALGQADSDDVRAARERVITLIQVAANAADPQANLQTPVPPGIDAKDAAKLAVALWGLRKLGQEALATDRDDHPGPVLPVLIPLLTRPDPPAWSSTIDPALEHGVLLVALTVAKLHPKVPVPVPEEILLYETWKTRPERFGELGVEGPVRTLRAYHYANAKLCDLAAGETSRLPRDGALFDPARFAAAVGRYGANAAPLEAANAASVDAAFRGLGEGSTALCYFQREQYEEGHRWLGRFVDTAEKAGIQSDELSILRSYHDCAEGDAAAGKARLAALEKTVPEHLAKEVAVLHSVCGQSRGKAFAKQFDRALFAAALARTAFEHLDRSGLAERLAQSPAYRSVRGFVDGVGGTLARARDAIPSADDVGSKVKGLISKDTE